MKYSKSVVLVAFLSLAGLVGCTSVPGLVTDGSNVATTVIGDVATVVQDAEHVAAAAADGAANLIHNLGHDFGVFWTGVVSAVPH